MAMVIYAYLRVSSDKQDLHNQRHGILEYANLHALSPIQFVEDTVSGREKWESRIITRCPAWSPDLTTHSLPIYELGLTGAIPESMEALGIASLLN